MPFVLSRGTRTFGRVYHAFAQLREGERNALRMQAAHQGAPATATLKLGQRVVRKRGIENGTVVEATDTQIKVKWDRGATSYFRRGREGDVLHAPPGEEYAVPFPAYLSSDDLDMLTQALKDHCDAYGISADAERDDIARLVMVLFVSGINDVDDMKAALVASRRVH